MKFEASICGIFEVFSQNSSKATGWSKAQCCLSRSKSQLLLETHPFASFVTLSVIRFKNGKNAYPSSLMKLIELSRVINRPYKLQSAGFDH